MKNNFDMAVFLLPVILTSCSSATSGEKAKNFYDKICDEIIEFGNPRDDDFAISFKGRYKIGDVEIRNIDGFFDGRFINIIGNCNNERLTTKYYTFDELGENGLPYPYVYSSLLNSENETVLVGRRKPLEEMQNYCIFPDKIDEYNKIYDNIFRVSRCVMEYGLFASDRYSEESFKQGFLLADGERIEFDLSDRVKYSYEKNENLVFTISSDLDSIGPFTILSPNQSVRFAYWNNMANGPTGNYWKKITLNKKTYQVKKVEVSYKGIDTRLLPGTSTDFYFEFEPREQSTSSYKNQFKISCDSYFD